MRRTGLRDTSSSATPSGGGALPASPGRSSSTRGVLSAGHHLDMLPPPSTTLTYVLEVISNPRLSCSDLSELIASDPALAAELLRAANSAYYGVSADVTSVSKAVVLLGTRRALSLAVGAAALSTMSRIRFPSGFDHRGLWDHLRATAIAARWLIEPVYPADADTAYISGLLHDLGKALYVLVRTNDWQQIRQRSRDPNVTFEAAEEAIGGTSHADMSGELLEHWRLPASLSRIVRHHHAPEHLEGVEARIAAVVRTADTVARIAGIGDPGDRNVPSPKNLVETGTCGAPADLQRLVQRLHDAATLFDAPPRRQEGTE